MDTHAHRYTPLSPHHHDYSNECINTREGEGGREGGKREEGREGESKGGNEGRRKGRRGREAKRKSLSPPLPYLYYK